MTSTTQGREEESRPGAPGGASSSAGSASSSGPSAPVAHSGPTVATQVPLELVIELVESRLHRRRQIARRWLLGTILTSLGLTLTVLGLLVAAASDYRDFLEDEERREALEKLKPRSQAEASTQQDDSIQQEDLSEALFVDTDFVGFSSFVRNEDGTHDGRLEQMAEQSILVALEEGRATAFLAKCDDSCLDLDLLLFDSRNDLVAEDSLADAIPLVEYTPEESGEFVLQVRMFRCFASDCRWELHRLDERSDG